MYRETPFGGDQDGLCELGGGDFGILKVKI